MPSVREMYPQPVADGLLALAGAVTGRPAATGGRTLENLGLADLDRSGMQALLHDGPAQ